MRVDGPYGKHRVEYRRYPILLLTAGGIGITPIISILKDLYGVGKFPKNHIIAPHRVECIYAIWTIPELVNYEWFYQEFLEIMQASKQNGMPYLYLWVYVTREKNAERLKKFNNEYIGCGRPDFDRIFDHSVTTWPNRPAYAFACGPSLMVNACWDACTTLTAQGHRFDFHHETFEW